MARKLRYNLNFFPHFHPPFRCWVWFWAAAIDFRSCSYPHLWRTKYFRLK